MQNLLKQEKRNLQIDKLYEIAESMGVAVEGFNLPKNGAVSVMTSCGNCAIGLDNSKYYSQAERTTMLAHELGHCISGAFYNEFSPFSLKSKCEKKADEWAILNCVPYTELVKAYSDGVSTVYELAEHFGVSETLIVKAREYYSEREN